MDIRELIQVSSEGDEVSILINYLSSAVSKQKIERTLVSLGLGEYYIYSDQLTKAAEELNNFRKSFQKITQPVELKVIIIAVRKNAEFSIRVSRDAMKVYLNYIHSYAGMGITIEAVLAEVEKQGVVFGISKKAIENFIIKADEYSPGQQETVVIASGVASKQGEDTIFIPLIEKKNKKVFIPKYIDLTDKVDLKASYNIVSVKENMPLMRKVKATKGKPGFNVYGVSLPAKDGKEIKFKIYKGSKVNENEPDFLEAVHGGSPVIYSDGVQVNDTIYLDKVDFRTGHIDFDGNVNIAGDVGAGMRVYATGDIKIHGSVEDAEIEAGGKIFIDEGVLGKSRTDVAYSSSIKAQGDIQARFAQYCRIESDANITFTSHVYHCEVFTSGKFSVIDGLKRQGTLMGGHIYADRGIIALNIGSETSILTTIEVFPNYKKYNQLITLANKAIESYEESLKPIQEAHDKLEKLPPQQKLEDISLRVNKAIKRYKDSIDEYNKIIEEYKNQRDHESENVSVTVFGHLYAGTEIKISDKHYHVRSNKVATKLKIKNNIICTYVAS